MKVYFAHTISDYDTQYEAECEDIIRSMFDECEILNPNIITEKERNEVISKYPTIKPFVTEMIFLYCPLIAGCDVLVSVPDSHGNISNGVRYEIDYAKRIGIKVIELSNTR